MLYGCHTYEIRNARVFCQVPFWCLSTPHFVKLSNPAIHIVISQFCQLHFCQIVKSTLSQVQFSCLPTFTFAEFQGQNCPMSALSSVHSQVVDCTLLFCYFVKLPSPLHLLDCPSLIFLLNLGKVHNELPSLLLYSVTLRCDVEMVFCFLLDKLTQHPYGVEAWHLLLLLSWSCFCFATLWLRIEA